MFHYAAYNESGRRIDSSYQKGQPARTRMGIQGLIPGEASGLRPAAAAVTSGLIYARRLVGHLPLWISAG